MLVQKLSGLENNYNLYVLFKFYFVQNGTGVNTDDQLKLRGLNTGLVLFDLGKLYSFFSLRVAAPRGY